MWTSSAARSFRAHVRARGPSRPSTEAAVTWISAPARDQLRDLADVRLHGGVSLRMCDHRSDRVRSEARDDHVKRKRPVPVGRLDQEVRRVATEREPAQLVDREALELFERDLAARKELEVDACTLERGGELSHADLHRVRGRRIVVADVRRRGDRRDPVGDGSACDLEGVFEMLGPVVEAREDVGVEVDQALEATARSSVLGTVWRR